MNENHVNNSMYFIESGTIEVSTNFDDTTDTFLIDRLGPGTVINYRSFFSKDPMYVKLHALTDVKILSLSLKKLLELV